MLEFIVLGQIPGTQLQITIAWFVFALLGLLVWADFKFHAKPETKATVSKAKQAVVSRVRA